MGIRDNRCDICGKYLDNNRDQPRMIEGQFMCKPCFDRMMAAERGEVYATASPQSAPVQHITKEVLLKRIKDEALGEILGYGIRGFVTLAMFIILLYALVATGAEEYKLISIILLAIFGFFSFICLEAAWKGIPDFFHPERSNLFLKYGEPDKVVSLINTTEEKALINTSYIAFSTDYIFDQKTNLIACNDVLGLHKEIHKTNGIKDRCSLVISDRYGDRYKVSFRTSAFSKDAEKQVDSIILLLSPFCPNAVLGYTQKQQEHIRNNTIKLESPIPDNTVDAGKTATTNRNTTQTADGYNLQKSISNSELKRIKPEVGSTPESQERVSFCPRCNKILFSAYKINFCENCGNTVVQTPYTKEKWLELSQTDKLLIMSTSPTTAK